MKVILRNLPMFASGLLAGLAFAIWVSWGLNQVAQIESITFFVHKSEVNQCHQ